MIPILLKYFFEFALFLAINANLSELLPRF